MRATRLTCLALLLSVTAMVTGTEAAAELSPTPTSWGVSGLAEGTLTDTIKSEVWAIEQIDNVLYVGGRFTDVTNGATTTPQPFLAAFDATTGEYLPGFDPELDNAVYALEAAPDGSRLFVGGVFSEVNGETTKGLIALNPGNGSTDAWSGRIGGYNLVRNIDLVDDYLYVVGGFGQIKSSTGSAAAGKVGRFNWHSGAHDPSWLPQAEGGSVWGIAANHEADRVYLVGYFDSIDGSEAPGGFKAVSASAGEVIAGVEDLQINTKSVPNQYAYDVEVVNGLVFVAGSEHYVQVLNESDLSLRKFHMSQPSRGDYQDLELVGDRIYAGCHCRQSSFIETAEEGVLWWGWPWNWWDAPVVSTGQNSWATAFSATTGDHIKSFIPDIQSSGPGIWAIHAADNGCAWFGGNITFAEGTTQHNITKMCDGVVPTQDDKERPSTPGAPQIDSTTPTSVSLTWNASTDNVAVAGYRIYNNDTGQVLLDTDNTSGTITELTPGTYPLHTRAYDEAGNESYRSGIRQVKVGEAVEDTQRPSTPSGLTVSGDETLATLTWGSSSDNIEVVGYRVFDKDTGDIIADVTTTSAILQLSPGIYRFYIKAYDAAGNLSWRSNDKPHTFA